MTIRLLAVTALAVFAAGSSASHAQTSLKVMVFPSLSNLPTYVAQAKGLFAKRGLTVEVMHTPNSDVLRDGLAKGDHQIVHAAVDNAVAMADVAKADIAVIWGETAASTIFTSSLRSRLTRISVARPSRLTRPIPPTHCCCTKC